MPDAASLSGIGGTVRTFITTSLPMVIYEGLPFLMAYVFFYALVLRPPRVAESARQKMVANLVPGDVVVSAGTFVRVIKPGQRMIVVDTGTGPKQVTDLSITRLATKGECLQLPWISDNAGLPKAEKADCP